MGRFCLLIIDNGAMEVLAKADDASFAASKSPKSILSKGSLLEMPPSSPLPTFDVDGAEDPADDDRHDKNN